MIIYECDRCGSQTPNVDNVIDIDTRDGYNGRGQTEYHLCDGCLEAFRKEFLMK